MREEALDWLESAVADLEDARAALERGRNHLAVFLAHQAVEKALKAYMIGVLRRRPSRTHDLVELLNETGLRLDPADADAVAELSPYYTVARYPNAGLRKPWKEIPRSAAERFVSLAERIVELVRREMERATGTA